MNWMCFYTLYPCLYWTTGEAASARLFRLQAWLTKPDLGVRPEFRPTGLFVASPDINNDSDSDSDNDNDRLAA